MMIFHTIFFFVCLLITLSYIKDGVSDKQEFAWSLIATVLNFVCIMALY